MTNQKNPGKRLQLHFDVANDDQAAELTAAWQEIVSGERARLNTAAEDLKEVMERARPALQLIVKAIEDHPGTGQGRRLARFLAGIYNGSGFPFDLTDLRALDTELANACIDYLNYDRLNKVEVHTHLPEGERQMQRMIAANGIRPQLHLSTHAEHEGRLFALAERLDRDPDALLKEALEEVLFRYEAKAFGGLTATQPATDYGDRPLIHARLLSESEPKPLCRANDGPWTARSFDFMRLTCHECQSLVVHPDDLA